MISGIVCALAAITVYRALRWLRDEFKPKPSYAPLFRRGVVRGIHP